MTDQVTREIVAAILPFELLKPPLYWRNHSGQRQRIWSPTAGRRAELRVNVYGRDDFTCQICGKWYDHPDAYDGVRNIDGLSLGHIIDYRDGGPYVEDNLQAECATCNLENAYMVPPGTPSRDRFTGRGDGAFGAIEHG